MFDLRAELYRIFGADLTNVPRISAVTAQTILCEVGTDISRLETPQHLRRGWALSGEEDQRRQGNGPVI